MAKEKDETAVSKKAFVNPFTEGVSLKSFIDAVGSDTVEYYLTGQFKNETDPFTPEDVNWLESEIKKHAYNIENKEKFLKVANAEHKLLVMSNNKKIEE